MLVKVEGEKPREDEMQRCDLGIGIGHIGVGFNRARRRDDHLAGRIAVRIMKFIKTQELFGTREENFVSKVRIARVLVVLAHERRGFQGSQEMIEKMARNFTGIEDANIAPPACLHDVGSAVMKEVGAAISTDVQSLTDKTHSGE